MFFHIICIWYQSYESTGLYQVSGMYTGLPKIFGVSFLKLQTGNEPKTWRYTKFQVNPRLFYLVRRALKTSAGLPLKMASGGHLRGSADVVKRPRIDLKLGIPLVLGQFPVWSLRNETPKILGSPSDEGLLGLFTQDQRDEVGAPWQQVWDPGSGPLPGLLPHQPLLLQQHQLRQVSRPPPRA